MFHSYQTEYSASSTSTAVIWEKAISQYIGFRGTPVKVMQESEDEIFLAGPVFCAAMKILSGLDPKGDSVGANLAAMRTAKEAATEDELGHAEAVEHLAAGEFSAAARRWDAVLEARPGDILAHKCAHETWFLVGDAVAMRASTEAALGRLEPDHPAYAVAASQHGFALEETGDYSGAEAWGRLAIDMAPSDCWALHCLAHVYESQNRHSEALALLDAKKRHWSEQNLLNAHIWWHLALRQIEVGDFDAALQVFDTNLADVPASNRFRLTDGTSLLWRLELEGVNVGARWRGLADKWANEATLHTNAFLDLHAALAFARSPDHTAADLYFDSLSAAFADDHSENAEIYRTVLQPLVDAVRQFPEDPGRAAAKIAPLLPSLNRIGGSIVQREIVERSYSSALIAHGGAQEARDWLAPKLERHPNTPWLLRQKANAVEALGQTAKATLLRRRADLMFGGWA